jgi:hypothetical protein
MSREFRVAVGGAAHGKTSVLSAAEVNDLVMFLQSR